MYALTLRKVSPDFFIGIGLFCICLFCVYALTLRKVFSDLFWFLLFVGFFDHIGSL